jgi:3',5'-cyclic-AMP phosphodiesterase
MALTGAYGVDRRGFLKCMAWAGTTFCVMSGGVLKFFSLSRLGEFDPAAKGELQFVQISDSHMGFNKSANQDPIPAI